ncbi:hypothetical protein KM043_007801 [Ampulex compressa]|nr:hypothetical protein KM043_007801 [Ampulex compressa]
MIRRSVSFLFLGLLLIAGSSAQCLTGNDNPAMMSQTARRELNDARFGFSLDSLKKVSAMQPRDNIFFSPHSINEALILAYFGARGTTEASLKSALHIPQELSKIDVHRLYAYEKSEDRQRAAQEDAAGGNEFKSANRLWMTSAKKLRECMLDFFGDQLQIADFKADPNGVRDTINGWVSNVTKGHIRDLLPPGSIDESTDLVLSNAVYFKGLWRNRFDAENSKRDIFYASGSQNVMTTFMRQKKTFNYVVSEELGAHVLELPYKGNTASMFVLLPPFVTAKDGTDSNGSDGVRQLVERLATEKGRADLRELLDDGMPPREVEVSLPRFELERDLPLGDLLRALGAGELMTPNGADLRGFLADGKDTLHLGDGVHRAKIEVTEEGTTAAAATAIFSFRSSRPIEPAIFKADHPFVYLIYERPTRTILFSGVFRSPAAQPSPAA